VCWCAFLTPVARAQVDTLESGEIPLGFPVVAQVQVSDIAPIFGRKHVVYTRDGQLRHAWKDVGSWQIEDVGDQAYDYDLAVDGDGLATIAYTTDDGRLMCASRNTTGWQLTTIASYPGATILPSVALGPEPGIAFLTTVSRVSALHYARRTAGSWSVADLDPSCGPWAPSLAFDNAGRAIIAYVRSAVTRSGFEVALAENPMPNGSFALTEVDTTGSGPLALAWDGTNRRPRVAYHAAEFLVGHGFIQDYIYCATRILGTWTRAMVTQGDPAMTEALALALDPHGTPAVVWMEFAILGPTAQATFSTPCSFFGHPVVVMAVQQAGAPEQNFRQAFRPIPTLPLPGQSFSTRSVTSGEVGAYAVAMNECPESVLYTEVVTTSSAVPPNVAGADVSFSIGPNPISGAEAIQLRWSQPAEAGVAFDLFDIAGRTLARRDAERWSAGAHAASWRPGALAPGVYWLSLRRDGRRAAAHVLVVR
jgi:hypothetical protein